MAECAVALCMAAAPGASAVGPPRLIPPVDGAIGRAFEAPRGDYGRGHRGVDFAVPAGTAVRAAGDGTVAFAGRVAGAYAVTVVHAGGLESTYSRLAEVAVSEGERVARGAWIGSAGSGHPGSAEGLHLGVKLHGDYVDPAAYLVPSDLSRALHLAPLRPAARSCAGSSLETDPPPPNDNVAVAVAGFGSATSSPGELGGYRGWLTRLGYAPRDSYVFSYRGSRGKGLHEPYSRSSTFRGIGAAAERLGDLLGRIARSRPGEDVDLVAHSQGGVVARLLVQRVSSWPGLPRVEHLVTLASPHRGAPAARLPATLAARSPASATSLGLSWLAERGWLPLPLRGGAVRDLTPGSDLLVSLARQDVAYGTRVLALAMPHDLVVPADRAGVPHEIARVVAPTRLWGHGEIVGSPRARRLIYDFLRDAPEPCRSAWDVIGPLVGRLVSVGYEAAARILP